MRILVTLPVTEAEKPRLSAAMPGAEILYYPMNYRFEPNPGLTMELCQSAEIIIGFVPTTYLKDSPNLRWLQLNSAGHAGFVAPGVLPEGVTLTNATGAYGPGISEHMVGAVLALMKKFHLYMRNQQHKLWRPEGSVTSLDGATVLILGLGDIGGEFAKKCRAMGSYTIGVRRKDTNKPEYLDELHLIDDLDSQLPRADVVAMSLPGTPATKNILNRERMEKMKTGSYLINVGRGTAVDTDALYDALRSGKLGGASLDVTDPEPLPADHPLWEAPNLLITPHVSGGFNLDKTRHRILQIAVDNLTRYYQGEPLEHQMDFATGYAKK